MRGNRQFLSTLFLGMAVVFAILGAYLLVSGRDGAWPAVLAAVSFAFFGNLDRIKEFEFGLRGIIAKTNELNREAEAKVEDLRSIAKSLSQVAVTLLVSQGRWGGGTTAEQKSGIITKLIDDLRQIGLSETDLAEVRDAEYPYACFDYVSYITRGLPRPADTNDRWNSFFSAGVRKGEGIGYEPTPDELEKFLKSVGCWTDHVASLVSDYRYYRENHKHRDLKRWHQRAHWNAKLPTTPPPH